MRPPPRRRLVYATGYLLMASAGVCAVLWPTRSVEAASNRLNTLIFLWAVFLSVGGLLAGYGAISDKWLGEYCGLPLLASVFAIYGIGALALAPASGWTSLAGGLAFLAIAALIVARWAEVAVVRRAAAEQAADMPGRGGDGDAS